MFDALRAALVDSLEMIPFLMVIYYSVEWFERTYARSIESRLQNLTRLAPALGAVFGCIPQCGFSAAASALYARRAITTGTLLAVFLATSDEAIPVLLAQPHKGMVVLWLIVVKLIIGIAGGYFVDVLFQANRRTSDLWNQVVINKSHERARHDDSPSVQMSRLRWLIDPLKHTAEVFFYIVVFTFGMNYLISFVGEANFGVLLLRHSLFQPFFAALFGLIPNCSASVAIAEAFLKGGLSYGSAIAGLSSSGGMGILVLLKENHNTRDTFKILSLLVAISTVVGTAIHVLYG